jgi:hypothetical protein
LLAVLVFAAGAWAVLALLVAGSDGGTLRRTMAAGMALVTIACATTALVGRGRRYALAAFGVALVGIGTWFALLAPATERARMADVAQAPWAEIDGDQVTIHNVHNFAWRTESDFTPRWETRTVELSRLDGVDLVASYWMGDAIAHVMLSFAFEDAPALAVSIETRKEAGEPYSTLLGFFRRYELVYVVADERNLIGVRTNVRADPLEDVYLYRVAAPKEGARASSSSMSGT